MLVSLALYYRIKHILSWNQIHRLLSAALFGTKIVVLKEFDNFSLFTKRYMAKEG